MRILISTDIEGVAGVVNPDQTRAGNPEYERARRWMTHEANAAVLGVFDGGATQVLVNDSHGSFRNLLPDELDPRARCVTGKPRPLGMMAGLEAGCDGVLLVGYHARSQASGVLAHTINSFAFARIWLNDQELGEAGIYGALAGEMGVPVIFASGDDVFAEEIRPLFEHCTVVVTKNSGGRHSAVSLSPQASCTAIRSGAQQAMGMLSQALPFVLPPPIVTRLQVQTPALADLFCQWPTLERLDTITVQFASASVEHAVRVLNSLSAMSFMLR